MLFSHRNGLKEYKKTIQIKSVDKELRNSLWTLLITHYYLDLVNYRQLLSNQQKNHLTILFLQLWTSHFKEPLDEMPALDKHSNNSFYHYLRSYFFNCNYGDLYDLLEFIVKNSHPDFNEDFIKETNKALERENSAYRFIGNEVVEITCNEEINEIDDALSTPFSSVKTHLQTALQLLSDKKRPDYRNSIKESISAVESLVRIVCKDDNMILSDGLKPIQAKLEIHPALIKGLGAIYAYTSDESGVRHSIKDRDVPEYAEAKLMLVICSSFVNYLTQKNEFMNE
ncbi:AbiJ-NTD4 domain-containing protein [Synechococcus sp. PCC 6312]|uniref:AbiJ-NTD4 domain-containing protein n=1 Tax=Synechococcus sp. (strain ATCC 27167 / PCC 6312) TaxID=195253 RepID=UPI00029ED619|nr:hypothetical protein [Synechococcus sp. PCC 6312]AFY62050.1 hypothetical protein Syn6312_2993 [Synechococcus sp. PCC 6312]